MQLDAIGIENLETLCTNGTLGTTDFTGATSRNSVRLFPNPANDYISIKSDSESEFITVSIFDYKGTEIIKKDISKINNKLDVSQSASGIYFARTNGGKYIRFIKR